MRRWLTLVLLLVPLLPVLGLPRAAAAPAVSLTLSVQPTEVTTGREILYTLTVANAGDQDVQGLVANVALPAGLAYVEGSTAIAVNGVPWEVREPAVIDSSLTWHRLLLPGQSRTAFGMHAFVQDKCESDYINYQLDRIREVAGPGAYVKQLLYRINAQTAGPLPCWVYFVNAAYDRDLIPVLRLQGEYGGPYWRKPDPDPGGGYATYAAALKRVVAGLPRREGRPLYVEIWNEPNLGVEWGGAPNPAEYGRFLVDAAAAIRSLNDPRIVILNGALSPGGEYNHLEYIDALAQVPGALQAFDVWASHPYPGNRPPEQNLHANPELPYPWLTIDSYKQELERLAARGRPGLRVLLTETGYQLGTRDLEWLGLPEIDEGRRADYIARALRDYWSRWPEVIGVCPFELVDPAHDSRWRAWDWLYPDGGRHQQYDAVAGLAKPSPVPGVLTVSFRATAWAAPGTYTSAASVIAGGTTLAAEGALAPVTVRAGAPVPTPVPMPPEGPPASQLLVNRSFESDAGWSLLNEGRGGYTTAEAHTGARSHWLGLPAGSNAYAFSSVRQLLSHPVPEGRSRLSFWYKVVSNDTAGDYFKVLVQDSRGVYRTLGYLPLNVREWTQAVLNTSGYGAKEVRFTVVNDGYGGATTVYIDDVNWTTDGCSHQVFLPLVLRGAQGAAQAAASRATVAVEPLGEATVTALELPAAPGGLHALAVDAATGLAYAAGDDGVWRLDPDGRQPARRLRAGAGGQALLADADGRRLWLSDREEGALIALDVESGRELARSGPLLLPAGVVAWGDRLFLAETEAARVVVLDRSTCGIIHTEPVGAAPYALAVDPVRERIWVANAGGRSLSVLDAKSGATLGAVELDGLGMPQGIAVDAPRRRVYAVYLLAPRYHALAVIDADALRIERTLRGNRLHPLTDAYGVAVEPGSGQVLLSDVGGLVAVDPVTLAVTAVAPDGGTASPFGLAVDAGRGRVLATTGDGRRVNLLRRQRGR